MSVFKHFNIGKGLVLLTVMLSLAACYPLTVNLNVVTDKPISLYMVVEKPIEVKLDTQVAITKLPSIKADGNIGITQMPALKIGP
ncbi:hypothetical protein JCM14076_12420 [Methylosoma difficile]